MKLKTIINRVRHSIQEQYPDSKLRDRYIWNMVYTAFTKILSQRPNLIYNLDVFSVIDLETETVDLSSTCVPLVCLGCRVKLPDTVDSKMGFIYRYITDGTTGVVSSYKLVDPKLFPFKNVKGNPQKYTFKENNYLYFTDCSPCKRISYLDPFGRDGLSCSILDNELNIPENILQDIVGICLNELSFKFRKPLDQTDNKDITV